MKELKSISLIYLKEYDVSVIPYLTYAQIQNIVNSVTTTDTWAEKQQNIDMLLLYYVTDIGKEQLEQYTHNELLQSGLIDNVKNCVINYYIIEEAINYTTSVQKSLTTIVKELSNKLEAINKSGKNNGGKK